MKKIMFNDKYGLTRAVLKGRKTMTRRTISQRILDAVEAYQEEYFHQTLDTIDMEDAVLNMVTCEHMFDPPYKVGEVVAIAQRYKDAPNLIRKAVHYYGEECKAGWNNKMFVKAEYMPHHIKITGIKVEPLCGISDEDCLKEGIYLRDDVITSQMEDVVRYQVPGMTKLFATPKEAYAVLINKVSGKGTWESNPLVWVYSFKLID